MNEPYTLPVVLLVLGLVLFMLLPAPTDQTSNARLQRALLIVAIVVVLVVVARLAVPLLH